MTRRIVRTKDTLSGAPRIAGTRIPTRAVWSFAEHGCNAAEIIAQYPTLTAADVAAALAYERRWYRRLSRWLPVVRIEVTWRDGTWWERTWGDW